MSDADTQLSSRPSKRRTADAFQAVFGPDGHRTQDQQYVMAQFREWGGIDGDLFVPNQTGDYDIIGAAKRDGAASIWRRLVEQLVIASKPEVAPPSRKSPTSAWERRS